MRMVQWLSYQLLRHCSEMSSATMFATVRRPGKAVTNPPALVEVVYAEDELVSGFPDASACLLANFSCADR